MFDITDPAFMGYIFECEEKEAEKKRRKEYEQYLQNNIKEKEEDDE